MKTRPPWHRVEATKNGAAQGPSEAMKERRDQHRINTVGAVSGLLESQASASRYFSQATKGLNEVP
jgi:hypothetical protein